MRLLPCGLFVQQESAKNFPVEQKAGPQESNFLRPGHTVLTPIPTPYDSELSQTHTFNPGGKFTGGSGCAHSVTRQYVCARTAVFQNIGRLSHAAAAGSRKRYNCFTCKIITFQKCLYNAGRLIPPYCVSKLIQSTSCGYRF